MNVRKLICITATDLFYYRHCKGDAEFLRPVSSFLVSVMSAVFQEMKLCYPKAAHRNVATLFQYHCS